jgi:NLR family CARD domain-containing protein 3
MEKERETVLEGAYPFRIYIHDEVEKLNLDDYGIDAKEAKLLAEELATNRSLEDLSLGGNWFGDDGAVALARAVTTNKSLRVLWLYRNGIGDVGLTALADSLKQNESLETFSVEEVQLGNVAVLTSFANALKINKGLKELNLGDNSIDSEGAAILADALKVNTTLTDLELSDNSIEDEGATSILNALAGWNTTLTTLALWGNDISETIHSAINTFVDANRVGIRLLHAAGKLDLSSKGVCDGRATIIAMDLADSTTVTTLILNKNDISHQGCAGIADALVKNCSLISIELNDNSIGDAGCSAMAATLVQNTVLTTLWLNGNGIGLPGATALAESLQVNTSLQVLGLGRNDLGNDGAVVVANALRSNTSLARLDLDGNNISDEGAMALLTTLKSCNCTLVALNLEGNADISPALQEAIISALDSRQVLNFLLKHLLKPLAKGSIPSAVQVVHRGSIFDKEAELAHCDKAAGNAGFVFHLVRAAALNDSKVIKERACFRKHSRAP